MSLVPFDSLPDSARVWVFGSGRPLTDNESARLLAEVDRFLMHWHAHGHPLESGRDWRDAHFLTIAVDQTTAGASGCSIDGLYRALRALESAFETTLVDGTLLFHRDAGGEVRATDRTEFRALAARGDIRADTRVFDLALEELGAWRERFEVPARSSWHARLLPREHTAGAS